MKRIQILILLCAAWMFLPIERMTAAPRPPEAFDSSFQFGFFYSALRPHGEWIELDDGFYVWRPLHVRHGWRPYLSGRWAWTNRGWYWVSHEPFGWVVFHYGRWYFDDYYGWVWIPDDVWGPSWVEWRYDDHYIGWAPLPPYAGFHMSFGLRFTRSWSAPVHYWSFVQMGQFGREVRYRDLVSEDNTRRLIRTTRSARDYDYRDNQVINRGIDPGEIERRGNRRIERMEVTDRTDRQGERVIRGSDTRRTERIEVFRPKESELRSAPERIDARRGDRRSTLEIQSLRRGRETAPAGQEQGAPSSPPAERERPRTDQRERRATPVTPAPQPGQTEPQERKRRESPSPQIEQRSEQREQKVMRKELLERYGRQTPVPPAKRETPRIRPERQSSPSPAPQSSRRSGGQSTERRRK